MVATHLFFIFTPIPGETIQFDTSHLNFQTPTHEMYMVKHTNLTCPILIWMFNKKRIQRFLGNIGNAFPNPETNGNHHGSAEPRGETVLKGHVNVQKVCEREASCRWYCWWFRYPARKPVELGSENPIIYRGFIDPRWLFGISEPSTACGDLWPKMVGVVKKCGAKNKETRCQCIMYSPPQNSGTKDLVFCKCLYSTYRWTIWVDWYIHTKKGLMP